MVRKNIAELFRAGGATRHLVRAEISAAEAATNARDARVGRRLEIGEDGSRPERAGRKRHNGDRLVCAVTRWQICGDLDFKGWKRGRDAAHLRNRDGKTSARRDRPCAVSHGWRQRGVER